MENAGTSVPHDEIKPVPIVDVRAIPLDRLAEDAEVHLMVTGLIESMDRQSRVHVAMFSSAI